MSVVVKEAPKRLVYVRGTSAVDQLNGRALPGDDETRVVIKGEGCGNTPGIVHIARQRVREETESCR